MTGGSKHWYTPICWTHVKYKKQLTEVNCYITYIYNYTLGQMLKLHQPVIQGARYPAMALATSVPVGIAWCSWSHPWKSAASMLYVPVTCMLYASLFKKQKLDWNGEWSSILQWFAKGIDLQRCVYNCLLLGLGYMRITFLILESYLRHNTWVCTVSSRPILLNKCNFQNLEFDIEHLGEIDNHHRERERERSALGRHNAFIWLVGFKE